MTLHQSPQRRIDTTLDRVRAVYDAMSLDERTAISQKPWMATIETVFALRGMERAEEDVLGSPSEGLADVYDKLVMPGDNAIEALLKTFGKLHSLSEPSS